MKIGLLAATVPIYLYVTDWRIRGYQTSKRQGRRNEEADSSTQASKAWCSIGNLTPNHICSSQHTSCITPGCHSPGTVCWLNYGFSHHRLTRRSTVTSSTEHRMRPDHPRSVQHHVRSGTVSRMHAHTLQYPEASVTDYNPRTNATSMELSGDPMAWNMEGLVQASRQGTTAGCPRLLKSVL